MLCALLAAMLCQGITLAQGRSSCRQGAAGVAWGGLAGSKGTVTVPLGAQVQFVEAMRGTSALAPIPEGARDAVRVDDFRCGSKCSPSA